MRLADSSLQPCDLLRVIQDIHWKQISRDVLKSAAGDTPELFNWLQLIGGKQRRSLAAAGLSADVCH